MIWYNTIWYIYILYYNIISYTYYIYKFEYFTTFFSVLVRIISHRFQCLNFPCRSGGRSTHVTDSGGAGLPGVNQSWGIPQKWMVSRFLPWKIPQKNGWFRGSPILGNLHLISTGYLSSQYEPLTSWLISWISIAIVYWLLIMSMIMSYRIL